MAVVCVQHAKQHTQLKHRATQTARYGIRGGERCNHNVLHASLHLSPLVIHPTMLLEPKLVRSLLAHRQMQKTQRQRSVFLGVSLFLIPPSHGITFLIHLALEQRKRQRKGIAKRENRSRERSVCTLHSTQKVYNVHLCDCIGAHIHMRVHIHIHTNR